MSDEVAGRRHQVHHPIDDHHKHARQNERDGNFRRHHCQVVRAQTVKSGRSFARENPSVISHCTSHHHHHHHHCSIQPLTFSLSLYCVGHISIYSVMRRRSLHAITCTLQIRSNLWNTILQMVASCQLKGGIIVLYTWQHGNTTPCTRAGLTIRGPHTNVRRGPFSRTQSQDFLICGGALFPKSWRPFLVFVTSKRTLNVQTSKQRGKNLAADRRGPPDGGGPLP